MTTISKKDNNVLIAKVNALFEGEDTFQRVAIYNMPDSVLDFYQCNKDKINAEVMIVRSKDDIGIASLKRNHCEKVFFIFTDRAPLLCTSYFTSVCREVCLSKALLKRMG